MSTNPLQQTIEALAKEKGIEPDVVIQAMEEAVLTASRKCLQGRRGPQGAVQPGERADRAVRGEDDRRRGDQPGHRRSRWPKRKEMYGEDAEVEVGDQIEFPKRTDVLGRIAAQTAKQVIFQKVREAERENVFAEYNQRVGEVMNGIVKRFEHGDIIVEVGRVEAVLPRKEQSRAESYAHGDRVRAVIRGVEQERQGPADRAVAHRPGPADQAVRAGSAGDLRRHRHDPRRRARGRRPRQGGGLLARARRRPGRRLRRHEGHARAGHHPRAARREDRHRRVVRRPGAVRDERAQPGQGAARDDRRRRGTRHGGRRRGQASCRWRSARRARTCGSRPS